MPAAIGLSGVPSCRPQLDYRVCGFEQCGTGRGQAQPERPAGSPAGPRPGCHCRRAIWGVITPAIPSAGGSGRIPHRRSSWGRDHAWNGHLKSPVGAKTPVIEWEAKPESMVSIRRPGCGAGVTGPIEASSILFLCCAGVRKTVAGSRLQASACLSTRGLSAPGCSRLGGTLLGCSTVGARSTGNRATLRGTVQSSPRAVARPTRGSAVAWAAVRRIRAVLGVILDTSSVDGVAA
jgi:hypothetical protein